MVPPKEAREYLSACDAFLSATQPNPDGSPFFGSPTKLFEYMSLGKPIIASDLEQIAQVINPALRLEDIAKKQINPRESVVGILVKPNDVPGFVKAACWLVKQDTQVQKNWVMLLGQKHVHATLGYSMYKILLIARFNTFADWLPLFIPGRLL